MYVQQDQDLEPEDPVCGDFSVQQMQVNNVCYQLLTSDHRILPYWQSFLTTLAATAMIDFHVPELPKLELLLLTVIVGKWIL